MQARQRVVAMGISVRQAGHASMGGGSAGAMSRRRMSAWSGLTTKKNTAVAVMRNVSRALMKSP